MKKLLREANLLIGDMARMLVFNEFLKHVSDENLSRFMQAMYNCEISRCKIELEEINLENKECMESLAQELKSHISNAKQVLRDSVYYERSF
jgi:hypothetical protein